MTTESHRGTFKAAPRLTSIRRLPLPPAIVAPVVVACCLGVSLGSSAVLKGECFGTDTSNWRSRPCYNDIQPLYYGRGIDHHVFPYVHATLAGGVGSHGFNEYPVLTGFFMWATGWVAWSGSSYLAVTMILLSLCAASAAWLLWRMVGGIAVFWVASPILALYAFHNWDLLAVTASVAGIYLWWSGRPSWAALAFAVGGAFKLYPALFIVPLVCDQLVQQRTRKAAEVGAAGFGSLGLINLPFILINASGWWTTYRFHIERPPTSSGSIWTALDRALSTTTENRVSVLALAAALVTITAVLAHTRGGNAYPVVEWCAASTAAFIVLNKVSSPQYILWLVPFLALLSMRSVWWWILSIIATVRYAALFGVDVLPLGLGTADRLVHAAVILQAALLMVYMAAILMQRGKARIAPLPRPLARAAATTSR
jgi:Glycosyltransferase family 87